ncbi:MAG TPA: sulfite exporter TauE/SafE family protein [Vineibacter sp.]|nr:sulfite exporter TauE/SafE family protein [Vineibacter sp.]
MEFAALPLALLLTGVLSGLTHCAAMCGPFVLVRAARAGAGVPTGTFGVWQRLKIGALPAYHAGRALTYGVFGAVVGVAGEGVAMLIGFGWLRTLAIGAAILLLLLPILRLTARMSPPRWWQSAVQRWAGQAALLPGRAGDLALGAALGFLPCGMIYAALAVSAGAGTAWGGAVAMASFAIGTWMPLGVLGVLGATAGRSLRQRLGRWASPMAALNLLVLGVWLAHVG